MAAVEARHLQVERRGNAVRMTVDQERATSSPAAIARAPRSFWLEMSVEDARRVAAALSRVAEAARQATDV